MRRARWLGLFAAALAGCVSLYGFDPTGSDATIAGAWRIDGEPPSDDRCNALGANRIRVTFVDDRRPYPHPQLFFECTATQPDRTIPGTFDTRQSAGGSGPVIRGGADEDDPTATFDIRLEAIDGAGSVVAYGPTETVTVDRVTGDEEPGHVDLGEVTFYTGVVSAAWELGGQSATRQRCEDAGIDRVRLSLSGGGSVSREAEEPCVVGLVGTRVEPGPTYTARLEALDSSGAVVGTSAEETFEVGTGQECSLGAGCGSGDRPAIDLLEL
ncbi:MAG TPA: hypothetical protein RMH99_17225 [Sandaracinaceae bacterium LLY-WYZ-13_1]|nr:hypothetical protein [Sandaracinaceae bacterium LLY-WYZ-13_1]